MRGDGMRKKRKNNIKKANRLQYQQNMQQIKAKLVWEE
jgi:hypothetical protein